MRKVLAVIICCFVLATGYIAYVIAQRQTALQKFARYNDSWAVSQTVSEYLRLQNNLYGFLLDPEHVTHDDLRLRMDLMLGRLELLKQGNLGAFIGGRPEWRDLVTNLTTVLTDLDKQIDNLQPSVVKPILESMRALDGPLTTLASSSVAYDVEVVDNAHSEVRQLHTIFSALAGGLIICGIALILLLNRHNNLLDRAHKDMRGLTDDLRAATLELKDNNARLEHDAYHDALTELPNRALFRRELNERLALADAGTSIILLLDLDGFKDINDTLGHDVGDALLQSVATRLSSIREDADMVCRLGGDEFAFITSARDEDEALAFAESVISQISQPYNLGELEIKIGTCVGIAVSSDVTNADELFKRADLALYESKRLGPGRVSVFQDHMQQQLTEKRSFEADLQTAVQNNEMEVYYQPQMLTKTREICGFEALLRWTHPVRGSVPPSAFIPVAERTGLIHSLGKWAMDTACQEAKTWKGDLKIAINLSPVQFHSTSLIQNVVEALDKSGLDASRLELEITESVLLNKSDQTLDTLEKLKDVGIKIAMDDFGTGYSSLGNLRGVPFDKIKIDQSFLRDVATDTDALAIVEFVVGMAKSLRMTTIAEGIETQEQFDCMSRLGCDQMQGYLIGRPGPAEKLNVFRRSS
ncbi:putative bifunctional diguanylate cyclase/phosphodiesterase [Agrobacterium rosae]|uniref:EAL domain-containing protein n=1 Tax=Agrobacterium rosae TaxID=1972867 RepID=A0AAE5RYK2_9HYPH|nr:EAL domain-containing protein [Agrobacterium rosae]KAA3511493.1 EAL domain-containing protein [Agrobacterium rosae]KAA3519084.1 EAL domain-containing protein [Agrobacterium rosae]MCM2435313.1 EAL domain-containing protein [Agrobacterium rosae]MDX8332183.1 EAL domain-containing protein [Agrobacterium rosae]MQB49173.1 EAL domain-containing protein [Agrobacterium rosae]